jgi:hypothetical protein
MPAVGGTEINGPCQTGANAFCDAGPLELRDGRENVHL